MFRKNDIPEHVIAFAREQTVQVVLDRGIGITTDMMKRDFYQICENINQAIVKKIPSALPMEQNTVEHNNEHNIILMRVMQYKDREYYVNAVQVFVRVASVLGCKRWAQFSRGSLKMHKRITKDFTHTFTSEARPIVVSSKDMKVKDFYYKL